MKNTTAAIAMSAIGVLVLTGCSTDASVASQNLSKAADQFEVNRRIVAINGISGEVISVTEGNCSLEFPDSWKAEVVCKLEDGSFIKNFIIRADNTDIYAEQINGTEADTDQYRTIFKPEAIIPNVDRP